MLRVRLQSVFVQILSIALISYVSPTIGMLHDCSQNEEMFIFLHVFVYFGLHVVESIFVIISLVCVLIAVVRVFFFVFVFLVFMQFGLMSL